MKIVVLKPCCAGSFNSGVQMQIGEVRTISDADAEILIGMGAVEADQSEKVLPPKAAKKK